MIDQQAFVAEQGPNAEDAEGAITARRMPIRSALAVVRDSSLLALGLTLVISLAAGNFALKDYFDLAAITWIYTILVMTLAELVFPRAHALVTELQSSVQWTIFVAIAIGICLVAAFLGSLAISSLWTSKSLLFWELFSSSFKIALFMTILIGVNEVSFDRLKGQLEETKVRLQKEELARERAMKLASEARLTALEARIHPHFLFNALNSISSLIPVDPRRAERLVERMAALLRFAFDAHRNGIVRFDQEMKIVRDYLEIEQARLGNRLRYTVASDEGLAAASVPPFSIQTLVENSIKHVISPSVDGGEIHVRCSRNQNSLVVDVSDTGAGFDLATTPEGRGLDNLRDRLSTLFGDGGNLSARYVDGRCIVSMKVPAPA